MTDQIDEPPKAAPHEVAEAVDHASSAGDGAGLIEKVEAADVKASVQAGQFRDHPVVKVLGFCSEISDQPPAFTLATLAAVGGVVAGRPRMAEAGLRSLVALTLATAAKSAVKATVVRTRPFMLLEHGRYERSTRDQDEGPWNSFPSGHTANAVAVARAVSRVYPEAAPGLGGAALGIAAIQVPRAAHHPADVVAGAALGWAVEGLVNALWPKPARRRRD